LFLVDSKFTDLGGTLVQSLNLGAEYRSSAQLDLDSDYTVPRNILDDFPSPQAEILPDFLLHDPSSPILDHGNDDQNTRPEILSTSPDFFPATVLYEDKSDSEIKSSDISVVGLN
jgi:hypothetical protein